MVLVRVWCIIQIGDIHISIHCGLCVGGGGEGGCLSFRMILCVGCFDGAVLHVCIEIYLGQYVSCERSGG